MADLDVLTARLVPVILTVSVGLLLRAIGLITRAQVDGMKKLVINVFLPAMLFLAFSRTHFQQAYISVSVIVFAVCGVMLLLGFFWRFVFGIKSKYFPLLFTGFEAGLLGYSLYASVLGEPYVYRFAVTDVGHAAFSSFILMGLCIKYREDTEKKGTLLRTFTSSPIILAIVIGLLAGTTGAWNLLNKTMPGRIVTATLESISGITIPLILLLVGMEIKIDLRALGLPFLTVSLRLATLLGVFFLLNLLVLRPLRLEDTFRLAVFTMLILPPPFFVPMMVPERNAMEGQYVANSISMHIVFTIIVFAVAVACFWRQIV